MWFELTEEQRLLEASVVDWLAANPDSELDGSRVAGGDLSRWRAFASLGWLSLPFAEAEGGLDGGAVDVGVLMHAFGSHLVTQPYVSSVVVAGQLLERLGSAVQRRQMIPAVIEGSMRIALAHSEPAVSWPWARRVCGARRAAGGWLLSGDKQFVEDGHGATHWMVTASCDDGAERVFLVETSPRVERVGYRTLQGGSACDLRFSSLELPADAALGGGDASDAQILSAALASGVLAQCWGAAGAIHRLVEQTAAYVAQRHQFGRPLSDLQVVQHRLAEVGVESIEARACCELAAMRAAAQKDIVTLANAAKVRVAQAADIVAKSAIQLHGAMGVCEELPIAAAFRWLEAFRTNWGHAEAHAIEYGRWQLAGGQLSHSAVLEVTL